MYIYALLVLLWWFIYNGNKSLSIAQNEMKRYKFALKLALPLILVMGLRHVSVGSDTEQYIYRFNQSLYMMVDPNYQWEVGYNILNYFIHDILHLNFHFFLLITSAFYCTVLAKYLSKYSSNITVSFFLHLTIGIFTMSMSGIRQSLAISLCTMAFMIANSDNKSLLRKYGVALGINTIAYTFHNSSLIFFPFLFLTNIRLTRGCALVLVLLGASSQLYKGILVDIGSLYLPAKYEDMNFATNYVANVLVYIIPVAISLFCWYFSKTEKDGKYNKLVSQMFIFLSLTVFFINLMGLNNQLGRLSYYFIYSYYILIPYAFNSMPNGVRNIFQPVVLCVCAAYFIIGTVGDIMHIDEYHFFWEDVVIKSREYKG